MPWTQTDTSFKKLSNKRITTSTGKGLPEEKGASLFLMHCASCHGEDGKLGASGAKDLSVSKLTDKEIENIINNGKNAMPPMKVLLENKDNIELVIKHVKSLRK